MTARGPGTALSTVRLSDFGLRRAPPRPVEDRQPGYEALFDHDTLFYDVFRSSDGAKVICLGPPLLDCEPFFADVRFRLNDGARPLKATYRRSRVHLQPSGRHEITISDAVEPVSLTIEAGEKSVTVPVRASGCDAFRGRRVVITMVKDTPIRWIRDWAQFHVRLHGAESVILYDNGSSMYRDGELRDALGTLDAPGPHLVVGWDFPYGPGVGPSNTQDSFYCQPGGLDHARRRYCMDARSVLNCDIDELVVGPAGASVFEEAERAEGPGLHIAGRWVELVRTSEGDEGNHEPLRHRDFRFGQRKQIVRQWLGLHDRLLRTKWVALPARCDDSVEWAVHSILTADKLPPGPQDPKPSRRFVYRHFRQLTTKDTASRRRQRPYSPIRHQLDRGLRAAMQTAFGGEPG